MSLDHFIQGVEEGKIPLTPKRTAVHVPGRVKPVSLRDIKHWAEKNIGAFLANGDQDYFQICTELVSATTSDIERSVKNIPEAQEESFMLRREDFIQGSDVFFNDINNIKVLQVKGYQLRDEDVVYEKDKKDINEKFSIKNLETVFKQQSINKAEAKEKFKYWLEDNTLPCYLAFDRNGERLEKDEKHSYLYRLNAFIAPEYRKLKMPRPRPEGVDAISKYLKHLFPVQEQREYVLAWMYSSLVRRAKTSLCLIGVHGCGKTLFMEFMANLHGTKNVSHPDKSDIQFNDFLSKNTLTIYDELKLTTKSKEDLKRTSNDYIQTERKNEDRKETENHSSIILASNYDDALLLIPGDRRFSVPDLTYNRLETVFSKKEASKVWDAIRDPEVLRFFYGSLLRKYSTSFDVTTEGKFAPNVELRDTQKFEDCCLASAPEEIRYILDLFKKKTPDHPRIKEINFLDLKDRFKKDRKRSGVMVKFGTKSLMYSAEVFHRNVSQYTYKGKKIVGDLRDGHIFTNRLAQ